MSVNVVTPLVVKSRGDVRVVQFDFAVLDKVAVDRIRRPLRDAVLDSERSVMDLSRLRYVDHFGFDLLLECIMDTPGRLVCAGVDDSLLSLFIISQLASTIELFSSCHSAVAALSTIDTTTPKFD